MQRKPGFPVANCSIKMPDNMGIPSVESFHGEDDPEQQQRRQQLINFGHSQWGFNNWSWTVTKQELDFVDFTNGKYCAGVVAFVSITVKSFDIHRENIGYATSLGSTKGFAIYKSRKGAVTNALRETLLSFGGSVAADLLELPDAAPAAPLAPPDENNQNAINKPAPAEPKNSPLNRRAKDEPANPRPPPPALKNAPPNPPAVPPPALPPANRPGPRAAAPPAPAAVPLRPNSNEAAGAGAGDADEEARAERKRRQRQAQEEFRQRQLAKQKGLDEKQELQRNCSSFDKLLMELPSQDIEIQETGDSVPEAKRKSPGEGGAAKRRASVMSRLDIVEAD
ncbi:hypothetical protein ABMA27_005813 [Loxostege sticticalis]|uniref:Uncharacterized protein n=1 Tax=Loxostege sticticalis TaxID=481309 RepID=A0ABR3HGZ3_LOXSC